MVGSVASSYQIVSISRRGNITTVTTSSAIPGLLPGQPVLIQNTTGGPGGFNGHWTAREVISGSQFTYTNGDHADGSGLKNTGSVTVRSAFIHVSGNSANEGLLVKGNNLVNGVGVVFSDAKGPAGAFSATVEDNESFSGTVTVLDPYNRAIGLKFNRCLHCSFGGNAPDGYSTAANRLPSYGGSVLGDANALPAGLAGTFSGEWGSYNTASLWNLNRASSRSVDRQGGNQGDKVTLYSRERGLGYWTGFRFFSDSKSDEVVVGISDTDITHPGSGSGFIRKAALRNDGTVWALNGFTVGANATVGLTTTKSVKGRDGNDCSLVFTSGVLTSTNCP